MDFDNIITSGDISHNLLRGQDGCSIKHNWNVFADKQIQKRRNIFVFGSGDDDEEYCTSAGWTLSSIEDADLILARGTFTINDGTSIISKNDDEAAYWRVMEESMMKASRRKLPMLVSNPDKVRPGVSPPPPMPGAIGDAYERFVWTTHCHPVGDMTEESAREYVKRIGKPFREVYDIAMGSSDDGSCVDRSRAIMIGDALETDAVGGLSAGIDMLWVTHDGIHAKDVEAKGADAVLKDFNGRSESTYAYGKEVMPQFLTDHFRW
jgi:ribonucleotide monophosphatase NagD (HAD superfamily)